MSDKTPKAIEREQIRELAKRFGMTQKKIKELPEQALDALMSEYNRGGMVKRKKMMRGGIIKKKKK